MASKIISQNPPSLTEVDFPTQRLTASETPDVLARSSAKEPAVGQTSWIMETVLGRKSLAIMTSQAPFLGSAGRWPSFGWRAPHPPLHGRGDGDPSASQPRPPRFQDRERGPRPPPSSGGSRRPHP